MRKRILVIATGLSFIVGPTLYYYLAQRALLQDVIKEIEDNEKKWISTREEYISSHRPDTTSAYFLMTLGKKTEGLEMLNELVNGGDTSAAYAIAKLKVEGDYLGLDMEQGIKVLSQLCQKYMEPCLTLGDSYRKSGQFNKARDSYLKSAENNDLRSIVRLYELYGLKDWPNSSKEKVKYYAKEISNALELSGGGFFSLTPHTESAHNKSMQPTANASAD